MHRIQASSGVEDLGRVPTWFPRSDPSTTILLSRIHVQRCDTKMSTFRNCPLRNEILRHCMFLCGRMRLGKLVGATIYTQKWLPDSRNMPGTFRLTWMKVRPSAATSQTGFRAYEGTQGVCRWKQEFSCVLPIRLHSESLCGLAEVTLTVTQQLSMISRLSRHVGPSVLQFFLTSNPAARGCNHEQTWNVMLVMNAVPGQGSRSIFWEMKDIIQLGLIRIPERIIGIINQMTGEGLYITMDVKITTKKVFNQEMLKNIKQESAMTIM